jgi:hypothetical protein
VGGGTAAADGHSIGAAQVTGAALAANQVGAMGGGADAAAAAATAAAQAGSGAAHGTGAALAASQVNAVSGAAVAAAAATAADGQGVSGAVRLSAAEGAGQCMPSFNKNAPFVHCDKGLVCGALLAAMGAQPSGKWLTSIGMSSEHSPDQVVKSVNAAVDAAVDTWVSSLESSQALLYNAAAIAFFRQQWQARRPGQPMPQLRLAATGNYHSMVFE